MPGVPVRGPWSRSGLAREWAVAMATSGYVPLGHETIERELEELVDVLFDVLLAEPFAPAPAEEVGTGLADLGFTTPTGLSRTVELLVRRLPAHPELLDVHRLPDKVASVVGALTDSYAFAVRNFVFDQQEELKRALLRAKERAERQLWLSEARFREVFSGSPVGIAITDVDGALVETNWAIREMLGYSGAELAGRDLVDLVHPDHAAAVREAYRSLNEGVSGRLRERGQLLHKDGDPVWAYLAASVLRDANGAPRYHVTMVEDITELRLLQHQLTRQNLHDPLTGLPNRQFLVSRLTDLFARPEPVDLTLFLLEVDGLAVVNEGLGHDAGDALLRMVAHRLHGLVGEDPRAMLVRTGGDEFAVAIEGEPPELARWAADINAELAEPIYVGEQGIAASVSIGIVRQVAGELVFASAAELLRAAEVALRRVTVRGKRQWGLFDPNLDSRERARAGLAAAMPGAWENGELEIRFEPAVAADGRQPLGALATLAWNHPKRGLVRHGECIALAEQTGLSVPIAQWVLRTALERARQADSDVPVAVPLTADQAHDPDLVGTVGDLLAGLDFGASRLWIGMPVSALRDEQGEARDNLQVLAATGVNTYLHGFGLGYEDLACMEDLPARAVEIAPDLVQRLARNPGTVVERAVRDLVPLVREHGAGVLVDGIETEQQAEWWTRLGVDALRGPLFADTSW
ncbi:signal transduction protein [Longimycelium tulufanense]|uniref:Signal transduction protein n=1 Tax=Longimycelium tulufanense TaxID=907463 RepID=A0A8J3FUC0_9PSEU|nr:EAL domain-containing protein [Longimycelium tulufanense]GGM33656.1 signal transduction protein [Longimycelium tulufanense]